MMWILYNFGPESDRDTTELRGDYYSKRIQDSVVFKFKFLKNNYLLFLDFREIFVNILFKDVKNTNRISIT